MAPLDYLAALALAFGAVLGLASLFSPSWAAGVVRLKEDPDRPGGFSEFRATYGGLLLMTHGVALAALASLDPQIGRMAAAPLGAGWIGAAFGRTVSLALDAERNRGLGLNPVWIGTELALGIAILAPILHSL